MQNQQLDSQEMEVLRQIQEKGAIVTNELGQLEMMKLQLETRRDEIMSLYKELKAEEMEFGRVLSEKYGDGTINPETGEFMPASLFQGNPA